VTGFELDPHAKPAASRRSSRQGLGREQFSEKRVDARIVRCQCWAGHHVFWSNPGSRMKITKQQNGGPDAPRCSAAIVRRKYLADLRPEFADELSVRIEHEGRHAFFPLSENRRETAVTKGEVIRGAVARSGWSAGARFVREFTLAIFWLPNPLTCTYATLFTALRPPSKSRQLATAGVRVVLLEPDDQLRWGLVNWLNTCPGYECVAACDSTESFFRTVAETRPDLALFDEPPCTPAPEHLEERFHAEFPDLVGFPFGIYSDSEAAWLYVTGVDGGYYYRRRRPNKLLEPLTGLWQKGKPTRDSAESQIRNHVQTLFGFRAAAEELFPELTQRERDVLIGLQRGLGDKGIATMLNISTWTVHSHVKSLFEKLGVHSRTEAVMKYFQK
jgi:DNA-binding NarL/FixJ family response regulator